MHYKNSYEFGKKNELIVLEILKDYWNDRNIIHSTDRWSKYDYSDEQYKYELKTRTNNYSRYPTTMITSNKLQPNTILLFSYTDGLYYIEYNEDKFKTYETKSFSRAGIEWDEKLHVYIPIQDLIEIKKY